jgi:hypothetical protein
MLRRLLLIAILAPALAADPRQEVYELIGSMASALSEGDPARFLAAFDRSMKGYDDLAVNVRALVEQADVASTVDPIEDAGDARARTIKVDWLLELANKEDRISRVRRQKTVACRVEKEKGKWRIVSLDPLDFFAPPRVTQP